MTTEVRSQRSEARGQRPEVRSQRASCRAFTMIEIAISLAIIGFALVAILGVLPLGMNVQRENREETIINQDANVLVNAIRNGARGMDDLANYVIAITNYQSVCDNTGKRVKGPVVYWYTPNNSIGGPAFALSNGFRIVGLLSTPKYIPTFNARGNNTGFYSNYVVAAFRSLSGPVSEKFPQDNALMQDLAFSYRLISEVVPYGTTSYNQTWGNPMVPNLQSNLHEVRMTFRWPYAKGTNALGRQVYRTAVGGLLQETNEPAFLRPNASVPSQYDLYFFEPRTYVQAKAP
jgi:prepilin-type N-terminal cleavage/methylation domain-containing protein